MVAFVRPAHAYDEDALDDDESGQFEDDGEDLGEEQDPEPVCDLPPPPEGVILEWDLASGAEVTLPPAGIGNTWAMEYDVHGRGYDNAWTDLDQGSETASTVVSLSLPSAVLAAAEGVPLALTARAVLEDANGAIGVLHPEWLIVDKTSGTLVYERWQSHVWPQVPVPGGYDDVTDLDWGQYTAQESSLGSGNAVNVTFCIKVRVNYIDVANPTVDSSVAGEDYFTNNNPKYARGHWLDAIGPSLPQIPLMVRLSDKTLGSQPPGCGTLTLISGETYDIRLHANVYVRGQKALVTQNKNSSGPWWGVTIPGYVAPSQPTTVYATHPNVHRAWNVSASAAWAFHRRAVEGIDAQLITDEGGCNGGGGCTKGRRSYLTGNTRQKFVIVHELGHVIGYFVDDQSRPNLDYGVIGAAVCKSPSTTHNIPGKEYASAAAVEGFANYYVAVAFNQTQEADCAIEWFAQDFDGVNGNDVMPRITAFNCDGQPYWGFGNYASWAPTTEDHLGDPCDGVKPNRGTEYDWLRFLWDLDTEGGLAFGKILEVWDRANPKNWRKDDTGINQKPWTRMQTGATAAGVGTAVSDEGQDNGVSRL